MQSHSYASFRKLWAIFTISMLALLLSACGGGSTGQTWFNLPSIPVRIQTDGSVSVFGIGSGPVIPPETVQQLQSTNVQKLEVRPGYNGLHIYANGEDLPYIEWDETSMGNLQTLLNSLPAEQTGGAPIDQFTPLLSMLRQIGFGVSLDIPPADGQSAMDIPAWSGETILAEEAPAESSLALSVGSLAFDENGSASMEGISLDSLGVSGVALPPIAMEIFKAVGADKLSVATEADGLDISIGDLNLPRIAYNGSALERTLNLVKPLVGDPSLVGTLENVLPMLPGADINLDVSLTGEPLAPTVLPELDVMVSEDGSLSALGLPLPGAAFPPDLLAQLQDAGVGQLDVDISPTQILIAANKEKLPVIEMDEGFLSTFVNDMGPALGMDMGSMGGAVDIVQKVLANGPLKASVTLPGADLASMPAEVDMGFQAPADDLLPATIHLELGYTDGQLASIGGLSGESLGSLAESFPELPEGVGTMLAGMGASQLQLQTEANKLNINIDGSTLLSLNYDVPTLINALNLAGPFLEDSPLGNPAMVQLLVDNILPYAPGSDLDITVNVQ
ncbi:MAG: hypothetical protein AAF702_19810 [Chloroflexota bacterium]